MVEHAYIKEEIAKAVKKRPVLKTQSYSVPQISPPISIPAQERSKFLTNFLVSCIFLVSVATVFGLLYKIDWKSTKNPDQPVEKPIEYMTQTEAESLISSVESRVDDIESSFKNLSNRVWLLVIAHNENIEMMKTLDRKYHPNEPSDYIVFERDWKLNRMPRSIGLEEKDKNKLKENIK